MGSAPSASTAPTAAATRTTTFLVSNLYCPSSVSTIETALAALSPAPISVSSSIVSQCVTVQHDAGLPEYAITRELKNMGFEIHSIVREGGGEVDVEGRKRKSWGKMW
ncbi:MAG: hypothetical protein M1839_002281 [Geoglossum umbratile]|nr:MAG: hypothetical protein M1839_002281 [Geoglossum umbratile]